MRRGTPAAIKFGEVLRLRRTKLGLSMREVGRRIGAPASTVSQAEKGQRAVKLQKLGVWAQALDYSEDYLHQKWHKIQKDNPDPALVRRRRAIKTPELEVLISKLNGPERERVQGYIRAIIQDRER